MKYLYSISLILFFLFTLGSLNLHAQLGANSSVSAQQLVNNIIGQNVSVSNITLSCPSLASGTFTANGTNLGLTGGIILATGNITNAVGPNTFGSITTAFNSIGDSDLDQIVSPDNTKDACVLEFDIIPKCDTLAIYFVFGSEEYPEYVGQMNDVFAFFISGPGMPQQNIALIPGTATPISINNVNINSNSAYYVDNTMGSTIHYDGFTIPIQAKVLVQPCSTYHMKLAIADVIDDQYDSGVFLSESGLKCINGKILTMSIDSAADCVGSNGAVSVSVAGGGPTYSYSWSDGNSIISSINNTSSTLDAINNLNSGWYYVTVSDPSGCDNIDSIEVVSDTSSMTLSLTKTDASCVGVNDASAVISVLNGTPPYSFSWSGGINNNNISGIDSVAGLTSGWVNVSVTDSKNCVDSASVQVLDLPGISVTLDSLTNVSCYDSTDAGIYISATGGNAVYSYKWSNGSISKNLLNVSAGTYTLSISDITSCADTISYLITEPSSIAFNISSKPSSCLISDGSITLSISGGTPGYQYLWSNGSNDQNLVSLMAGTYVLTITDSMACIDTAVVIVSNIGGPSVLIDTVINLSCFSAQDGFASVNVSGGTPQYNYLWSNGVNVDSLSGVDAGTYFLTVSDQTTCIDIISISITEPDMLEINADSISNPLCYNDSNGYLSVLPIGGTSPYSYFWSGGNNSQSIDSLFAGSYDIIVQDDKLCHDSMSFILTQPSVLNVSEVNDSASCFGICDGKADITVSGGVGSYDFSWSHGSLNQDQDSLCGGSYVVTVTDSNGCNKQTGFVIGQPLQILISSINNSVLCNGDCDVAIDLNVSGGKPSYLYSWSNGDTIEDPDSLCAGSYSVQVIDNDSCSNNYTLDVLEPDSLTVLLNGSNPNCDTDNGIISALPSGGTSPYSYVWSGSNNNAATIIDLTDSVFIVTITDQNSCIKVDSIALIAEPVPVAGFDQEIGCSGDSSIFQDTSSGYVVSWIWDFGVTPQSGSSDQVPSYIYSDTGQFNVWSCDKF
ncbi:MAG TPA: hypothetical protein EYQ86_03045 [Bacteroidetes bacterium]|nr:hypothetical protein [Bacteroidota bacterium]